MLKFNYTKANGDVSERFGLIITPKSDNTLMLDLSGLDEAARQDIENDWLEYKLLHDALWEKYTFSKYIKAFKEEGISDRQVV